MTEGRRNPNLAGTWPLFDEGRPGSFPADPKQALGDSSPGDSELAALDERDDFSDTPAAAAARAARRARESLPPMAPEWMRAARALADWLEARIQAGTVDAVDQAAVARTWAAWSMSGTSDAHILRVAHLVGRAHSAIRETSRQSQQLQAAYQACAGVLHSSMPTSIRERMPFERALFVVRKLHEEADHWSAIVDGTAELLGWKDYARVHAAAVLRALIERER
ncbi:MAG TPA: hypothetical protein VHW01_21975 [Polyangiaceae bacterium]|jgi:hypothetical protein|nr:hypothetical protein [Polyangiaceae bacterium]